MSAKRKAFDVIVIGAGPAGETCSGVLAKAGRRVLLIERERVGGECAFWGCVPTKVLLRSAAPYHDAKRVPGSREAVDGDPSFQDAGRWRTDMVGDYDDSDHLPWLTQQGIELLRGTAEIVGPGHVRIDGGEYTARDIVVATGSQTSYPDIRGLRDRPTWTNREASSAASVPSRLAVLGAGAVGIELAHVFARYGSAVTVIDSADRILPSESKGLSELVAASLHADGMNVRCSAKATRVRWHDSTATLDFEQGEPVHADRILVASGREGRIDGLHPERAGARVHDGAIAIDQHCRAADGLWAVGDVTGGLMFTHVAKYHAHVAAANILGERRALDLRAVPRTVYSDPDAAAVGLTREQAASSGMDHEVKRSDFEALTRSKTYFEDGARGAVELIVDRSTQTIAGAWAFGPMASEWIGVATLAISARVPLPSLREVLFAYPTFTEAFHNAVAVE